LLRFEEKEAAKKPRKGSSTRPTRQAAAKASKFIVDSSSSEMSTVPSTSTASSSQVSFNFDENSNKFKAKTTTKTKTGKRGRPPKSSVSNNEQTTTEQPKRKRVKIVEGSTENENAAQEDAEEISTGSDYNDQDGGGHSLRPRRQKVVEAPRERANERYSLRRK
jgi:hypothetical protein